MTWDDDEWGEESAGPPDTYHALAVDHLRAFFETNRRAVFFKGQLAVRNEGEFFHWVTYRAISTLIEDGVVRSETRELEMGGKIKLLWHQSHRYYKRNARDVVGLVNEYGNPNIGAAVGLHGEQMVLGGFARRQFVLRDHGTSTFGGRTWGETDHNLDFIFERDEVVYGVEVKNTLSYMAEDELSTKVRLCEYLGVRPVIVARMLPKTWIKRVVDSGGYAMILKHQLYPWSHRELARRVSEDLGLPVDAPRMLADGTIDRFVRWHERNV